MNDHLVFDLFEFAKNQKRATGTLGLADLPRILNEAAPDALEHPAFFRWQAVGESREVLAGNGKTVRRPYLHLTLDGALRLICQRCLVPYDEPLSVQADYRIVMTEAQAEAAPLDEEDEVLVGSRGFNLHELLEEELLLALPLVSKHPVCPAVHPALAAISAADKAPVAPGPQSETRVNNPFSVLSVLKRNDTK